MSLRSGAEAASAIAAGQHGLVTTGQLTAYGVLPADVARLTRRGVLRTIRHGVHAVAGAPLDPYELVRAQWLAADPGRTLSERLDDDDQLVVTEETAAQMHGFGDLTSDVIRMNRPTRYRSRQSGMAVSARSMHRKEWELVHGLPVSTPRRTLEDLAGCGRWDEEHLSSAIVDAVAAGALDRLQIVKSTPLLTLAPHLAPPAPAASVLAKIAADARTRHTDPAHAQAVFYREMFMSRLAEGGDEWIVKGGTNLLARFGPVRATRDVDLVAVDERTSTEAADALVDAMNTRRVGDLTFMVERGDVDPHDPTRSIRVRVDVFGAGTKVGTFGIDVSGASEAVLAPDERSVARSDTALLPGYPRRVPMRLYALENQITDKICALYELHGDRPSTRYRDLFDLAVIARESAGLVEPVTLAATLTAEVRRRGLRVPERIVPPSESWPASYERFVEKNIAQPGEFGSYARAADAADTLLGAARAASMN